MDTLDRLPWAAKSSVFQKLAEITEVGALPREERIKYDYALKKYRDTLLILQGAEDKGKNEKAISIAKKMKEKGMTISEIVELTGVSQNDIVQL